MSNYPFSRAEKSIRLQWVITLGVFLFLSWLRFSISPPGAINNPWAIAIFLLIFETAMGFGLYKFAFKKPGSAFLIFSMLVLPACCLGEIQLDWVNLKAIAPSFTTFTTLPSIVEGLLVVFFWYITIRMILLNKKIKRFLTIQNYEKNCSPLIDSLKKVNTLESLDHVYNETIQKCPQFASFLTKAYKAKKEELQKTT